VPGHPSIRAAACTIRGRPENERGRGVNYTALAGYVRPATEVLCSGYHSLKFISAHYSASYVQLFVTPVRTPDWERWVWERGSLGGRALGPNPDGFTIGQWALARQDSGQA